MNRSPFLLLLLPMLGCSANYDLKSSEEAGAADTGYLPGDDADADTDTDADGDTDPEEESDFLRLSPAATNAYVFVANPDRDTVTRISVPSLAVTTVDVGDRPTQVVTTADYTKAVTFNAGSDSVSILDAASLSVRDVAVRENFNGLSLSPNGQWVMCWFDIARAEAEGEDAEAAGGIQSYNEVSFVNTETGAHAPMVVGFNPKGVRWSRDGQKALVVSDGSLAVVDLTADTLSPTLIDLADDPLAAPEAEEVELSLDGQFAFIRPFGADAIQVVDLLLESVADVPVGSNPTDLDLTPDGRSLAVVSRGSNEVWVLDAADPFAPARIVPFPSPTAYGQVLFLGDREQAVLFTTAARVDQLAIWDLSDDAVIERRLVKPIQTLGLSPDGQTALIFHTREDAPGADTSSPFYGSYAMTLMNLEDYRSNPITLAGKPENYAVSDDGQWGFFTMEGLPYLEALSFETLLPYDVTLKSVPLYIGVLPGSSVAYASQDHELGRISFYDAPAAALDTITGFELNSAIEHEEAP